MNWRQLEGVSIKKLRLIMAGEAAGRTHEWVRRTCRVYHVQSSVRVARLRLVQSIIKMIGNLRSVDSDLPTALLVAGLCSGTAQCDARGARAPDANPWLQQFADENRIAEECGALRPMPVNILHDRDYLEFLAAR